MGAFETVSAKIVSVQDCKDYISGLKSEGKTVVFTNGCFDILHLGHVTYLAKASELADVLIVGLNTDSSVKRIKGENRPLQDEATRAHVLASLQFVDRVVLFADDTPKELIDQLIPNFLVKGSDYSVENIVGADTVLKNGGAVKTIDLVSGYSTTNVIAKMDK